MGAFQPPGRGAGPSRFLDARGFERGSEGETLRDTTTIAPRTAAHEERLRQLIAGARRAGRWLACDALGLWFSPDELEAALDEARAPLAVYWRIAPPEERDAQLAGEVIEAQRRVNEFRARYRARGAMKGAGR